MLETRGRANIDWLLNPALDAGAIALAAAVLFGAVEGGASVVSATAAGAATAASTLVQESSVASTTTAGAATESSGLYQPNNVASDTLAGASVESSIVLLEHEIAVSEIAGAATESESIYQLSSVATSETAGAATESQALTQPTGSRPLMTRLQTTATIVGSDGLVSRLKDGRYRYSYAWSCTTGNWAALDLGTDAARTQILVCLSNESSGAGDIDDAGLANVTLKTSVDSTNGTDGTWTSYAITGNPYIYASRVIPFVGCRWLRLEVGDGCTAIDEFEVWNCTVGADAYLFVGDSITNRATKRHDAVQPSMQSLINTRLGQYPEQIGAGIIGIGALTLDANINAYLTAFPMCRFVLIGIGTNDAFAGSAGISAFTTRVTSVCNKIRAAGAEPILARIPWTSLASYGGGTYGSDNTYLYNQAIDGIVQSLGLRPGPDFYAYVYENQVAWYNPAEGGDGVHPGTTGVKMWNVQWADVVDDLYFLINNIVATNESGAAAVEAETLAQYPHVVTSELGGAATEASTLTQPITVVSGEFAGVAIEASTLGQTYAVESVTEAGAATESSILSQFTVVLSNEEGAAAIEESTLQVLPTVTSSTVAAAAVEDCAVLTAVIVRSQTSGSAALEALTLVSESYVLSDVYAAAAVESESIVFLINVSSSTIARPALVSVAISAAVAWQRPFVGDPSTFSHYTGTWSIT